MGLDDPTSKCVNVSGTIFKVPDSLYAYLKELPSSNENENDESKNAANGVVTVNADPDTFRWLLYYVKHQSLPTTFWQKDEEVKALQALAVTLGMAELVLYVGNHNKPKDGFLKTKMKRSSSWQKRAREHSKRKLDALAATIRGNGGTGGIVRKLKSPPSYEELQSHHVM